MCIIIPNPSLGVSEVFLGPQHLVCNKNLYKPGHLAGAERTLGLEISGFTGLVGDFRDHS